MFPNMKGETGIGELPPVHVDEDPQDIFDNLQMGAMLFLEARNDQWAFSSDVLFMDLEADIAPRALVGGGKAGVSQLGWEIAAMRRLAREAPDPTGPRTLTQALGLAPRPEETSPQPETPTPATPRAVDPLDRFGDFDDDAFNPFR